MDRNVKMAIAAVVGLIAFAILFTWWLAGMGFNM